MAAYYMNKFIRSYTVWCLLLYFLFYAYEGKSQDPGLPPVNSSRQSSSPVYLLNLTPIGGGKSYTLFRNTKVHVTSNDGTEFSGKVRIVSKDSILVDSRKYAVADITGLRFNPGTTLGAISAIGAVVGIAIIAVTVGGKDKERSQGEDVAFWGGVGLTAVSGAFLIPNYFIRKNFVRTKYEFRTIQIGSY